MSSHGENLISGPSADLPKKLACQAEHQQKDRAQAKKNREDPLSPHNLARTLKR